MLHKRQTEDQKRAEYTIRLEKAVFDSGYITQIQEKLGESMQ